MHRLALYRDYHSSKYFPPLILPLHVGRKKKFIFWLVYVSCFPFYRQTLLLNRKPQKKKKKFGRINRGKGSFSESSL